MHETMETRAAIAGLAVGVTTSALPAGAAKLKVVHREAVAAMPRDERQELRLLEATLEPGDRTPYHSHRHPVTVYMLAGTFTLELDGREPVHVSAGEVFIEPAHVRMTGRNISATETARMVLFYASTPDTPFADPAE